MLPFEMTFLSNRHTIGRPTKKSVEIYQDDGWPTPKNHLLSVVFESVTWVLLTYMYDMYIIIESN